MTASHFQDRRPDYLRQVSIIPSALPAALPGQETYQDTGLNLLQSGDVAKATRKCAVASNSTYIQRDDFKHLKKYRKPRVRGIAQEIPRL